MYISMSDIFAHDFFRQFDIDIFKIDIDIFVGYDMS